MTIEAIKHAGILVTLRHCRNGSEREAARWDSGSDYRDGFHAGRSHAFRFALALLDEDGPEARELESVEADVAPGVKKRG